MNNDRCPFLRMEEWPEEDRRVAFRARYAPCSPLDDEPAYKHWRDRTWETNEDAHGFWLGWLKRNGLLSGDERPSNRFRGERITAYYQFMLERVSKGTIRNRLVGLACFHRLFGVESVDVTRLLGKLPAKPARDHKLEVLPTPENCRQLALHLMQSADRGWGDKELRKRAVRYRDGLLLVLIALRGLRASSVANMTEQNLLRENGRFIISLVEDETKNKKPYEAFWPSEFVPHLKSYLKKWRKILLDGRPPTEALWVPYQGVRTKDGIRKEIAFMDRRSIYSALRERTGMAFVVKTGSQALRVAAASWAWNEFSDSATSAATLVGNTAAIAEAHYIHWDENKLLQEHSDFIARLRRK